MMIFIILNSVLTFSTRHSLVHLRPQIVEYGCTLAAEILSTRSVDPKNPLEQSSSLSLIWSRRIKNVVELCVDAAEMFVDTFYVDTKCCFMS